MMSRMLKPVLFAALVGALLLPMPAKAVSYMTTGGSQTGIGDVIGYGYDQIILHPYTSTISGPGTYTLNPIDFVAGPNRYDATIVFGSLSENLTVGSTTQTLTIPYSVAIGSADTLTIFGGTTLWFTGWKVVLDSLTIGPNGGGGGPHGSGTMSSYLTATVSPVPLPPALILFGTALAGMAVLGRRRRKQTAESLA